MILKGNARSGAVDLARHLMNAVDNDRVELAELRGVAGMTLRDALQEMEAVAAGTKCRDHLYSCSINPDTPMTREQYMRAIDSIEAKLGLTDQPRAVVFHHKESAKRGESREHCHVVWSRIHEVTKRDRTTLQAISMPFDRQRLREIARDLALELGHTLPAGLAQDRGGDRFTDRFNKQSFAETGQRKRSGIDPDARKAEISAAYYAADSGHAFVHALEERGYHLARGDKRGFVVVDQALEVHALARQIDGAKTKDVAAKLHPLTPESLPSVDQVQQRIAQQQQLQADQARAQSAARPNLEAEQARHKALLAAQAAEAKALTVRYAALREEARARELDDIAQVKTRAKDQFKPRWRDLFQQQEAERREFEKARHTTIGRLRYYLHQLKTNKLDEDARGILANAFNFVIRGKGDPAKMEKSHDLARQKLGREQFRAVRAEERQIASGWKQHHRDLSAEARQSRETMKAAHGLARAESARSVREVRDAARQAQAGQDGRQRPAQDQSRRDDWLRAAIPADQLRAAAEQARKDQQARLDRDKLERGPHGGGRTRKL